jgi:PAS domain S-box-containing protein
MDPQRTGEVIPLVRLRASEAASETAFALLDGLWSAPVGIAVFDRQLRFLQVNAWLSEVNGLPAAEHLGRKMSELFRHGPELVRRVEERVAGVFETGRPVLGMPVRGALPDGTPREWMASYYPVRAASGEVRAVCAVVIDVTDERDREHVLERAREDAERGARRLAFLQEVTAALSAASDPAAMAEVVVERVRPLLGARTATIRILAEDATLQVLASRGHPGDIVPPALGGLGENVPMAVAIRRDEALWVSGTEAIAERFPALAARAREEGQQALVAIPLVARGRRLGALGLVWAETREFDLEERAFVLAVAEQCALALDRALLHESERNARADAERARALLDALLENAPVGIGFLDREMRFQRLNHVLADAHGTPVEAHLGRTPQQVLPGAIGETMEAAWRRALETGRPQLDVEVVGETPLQPGKRRHFLQSWYAVAVRGETIGAGAVEREITAEREAEAFQRHVFGIVGHDLRGPLSAMMTAAKLLARGEDVTARQVRLLARLQSSAERMEEIIRVLLDYAQIRGGHALPIHRRRCDVAEICRRVADECEAANAGREVRCTGAGEAIAEVDPDRVAQVVSNLVSNALAYSPRDSRVELRWGTSGAAVSIDVTNLGPPIPPDLMPRLFEPFRRGEIERRGGGLGLGLFIARGIVEGHGGSIEVTSAEGAGTVFRVVLPR